MVAFRAAIGNYCAVVVYIRRKQVDNQIKQIIQEETMKDKKYLLSGLIALLLLFGLIAPQAAEARTLLSMPPRRLPLTLQQRRRPPVKPWT
jgi:uncharacterized membrane protein